MMEEPWYEPYLRVLRTDAVQVLRGRPGMPDAAACWLLLEGIGDVGTRMLACGYLESSNWGTTVARMLLRL